MLLFTLLVGILTQYSDEKLCKADLGLPHLYSYETAHRKHRQLRSYLCVPGQQVRPRWKVPHQNTQTSHSAGCDNFCIQSSVGRPRGRSQEVFPLGTLSSSGNHTHALKTWKIQMQRVKAKEGQGEAKKCWETSSPGRIGGKDGERPSLPLLSGNSLKFTLSPK